MRLLLIALLLLPAPLVMGQQAAKDSLGTRLRLLAGGRFVQGSSGGEGRLGREFPLSTNGQYFGNAESPAHVTWISKPFYLAETEVTVAQFRQFVETTGYVTSAERGATEMVGWDPTPEDKPLYQSRDFARAQKFNWRNPGFSQQDQHPVVGVSWDDAHAYLAWLSKKEGVSYRLPSEAEWELACRAGSTTWFSFGDNARGVVHRYGNLGNVELERHRRHSAERQWLLDWDNDPVDGHVFTAPVGSYQPNAWGLSDMHGNVWEWCEDYWLDTFYRQYARPRYDQPCGTAVDPLNRDQPQTKTNSFRSIRGGSWYNGDVICRSANRTYWDQDDAACYLGFRIARDAPSQLTEDTAAKHFQREQQARQRIEAAGGRFLSRDGIDLEVRFEGEAFDEAALTELSHVPGIERLAMAWRKPATQLSDRGLAALATLQDLKSLVFASSLDPDAVDLSRLSRLTQLERLEFPRSSPLADRHLAQFSALKSLKSFTCYGTGGDLTDAGLAQLRANRSLQTLNAWETDASGRFLSQLTGCPLRELALTARSNTPGLLEDEQLATLDQFAELQSLQLDNQGRLSGATLQQVARHTRLRMLSLDGCQGIEPAAFSELAALRQLRELRLRRTRAGDAAAEAIARLPRIDRVHLVNDQLTDAGAEQLSRAFSVRHLEVGSQSLTDAGLRQLGRIHRLENLTVQSPQVTGSGLGPLMELPRLNDLSLICSGLTDVAFDHLSRGKSLLKLRLAHRGHQPPAALTDSGLSKMAGADWLRELWLPRNDTALTEDAMRRLGEQLPKTKVIPYTVDWSSN